MIARFVFPVAIVLVVFAVFSCAVYDSPRRVASDYDRDLFGSWVDADRDCLNTRHELLSELSTILVQLSDDQCHVVHGRWYDPYTGKIEMQASSLDIDHVVPLKWAWPRGAADWSPNQRRTFANDPRNLVPVAASVNRSKGGNGPENWLPPYEEGRCGYVLRFLRVAKIYGLVTSAEDTQQLDAVQSDVCS